MIARIKKTGKLIDVVPYGDEFAQLLPEGDFKIYTKDEIAKTSVQLADAVIAELQKKVGEQ